MIKPIKSFAFGQADTQPTPWAVYALLVAAALALRFMGIGRSEIWHDEACSVVTATSPRGIWNELRVDTNAPLYFLLLKGWIAIMGMSAAALRSLSVIFGTAAVATIGPWLRRCGMPWRTALWGMALCGIAPLQIYYSQEARPYAMVSFLVVLSLWTFARAVNRGESRDWFLHGLCAVAGVYAHNLFIPWLAGFWVAAAILQLPKRQWVRLAGTYAGVALICLPGVWLVLKQASGSGGTDWIKPFWESTQPILAIPKSLEALSIGRELPVSFGGYPIPEPWRWVGLGLVALAAILALLRHEGGRWRWAFAAFTLWYLGALWLYSILLKPLYVVGRYDVFVQPAFLALLAMGTVPLRFVKSPNQRRVRLAAWGCGLLLFGIMARGLWARWQAPLGPEMYVRSERGEFMSGTVSSTDVLVCMELEGASTVYQCRLHNLSPDMRTLPVETLSHLGWAEPMDRQIARAPEIERQMDGMLDELDARGAKRIWILIRPTSLFPWESGGKAFPDFITAQLMARAEARGWREGNDRATAATLRIAWLER